MPTIYVIAGPNGIGKTTSTYNLIPQNIPIINSDEIASHDKIKFLQRLIKLLPANTIRKTLKKNDAFTINEGNKVIGTGVIENALLN